jgi:hypothetical protein
VAGAGHLTPAEAPDTFNAAVRAFLADGSLISGTGSTRRVPSR